MKLQLGSSLLPSLAWRCAATQGSFAYLKRGGGNVLRLQGTNREEPGDFVVETLLRLGPRVTQALLGKSPQLFFGWSGPPPGGMLSRNAACFSTTPPLQSIRKLLLHTRPRLGRIDKPPARRSSVPLHPGARVLPEGNGTPPGAETSSFPGWAQLTTCCGGCQALPGVQGNGSRGLEPNLLSNCTPRKGAHRLLCGRRLCQLF